MKTIETWRQRHARRIAIEQAFFWSAVGGALLIWPAVVGSIPLSAYVAGGLALSVANGVATYLKQPGTK